MAQVCRQTWGETGAPQNALGVSPDHVGDGFDAQRLMRRDSRQPERIGGAAAPPVFNPDATGLGQIPGQSLAGAFADGHHPVFAAFAQIDADKAVFDVHVRQCQLVDFVAADAAGVKQFKDGPVPQAGERVHVRRIDQLANLARRQDALGQEILDLDIRHGPGRIEQDRVGVFQMGKKVAQTDLVGSDGVGGQTAQKMPDVVGHPVPRDFAPVSHARRFQPARKVAQDGVTAHYGQGLEVAHTQALKVVFDDLIDIHKPFLPLFW